MGIRGLSSYFSNRDSFFQTVSLEGIEVIIDANNLRYSLYRACPGTNHAFGGDYDKYYRYVRHYFETFLKCNIRPILVFDGGYDVSDNKLRTTISRAKDQIRSCAGCRPTNQGKLQVYPLLGKEVFLEVLRDLEIEILQTDFEADQIIAQMGMERGCPVLSNDSDFFVFSVDFIRLDSVDLERSKAEGSLCCELFNRQKFLEHYNIQNSEMLHLLASLIGNDYIPPSVFDIIFSNIKMAKKTKNSSERHRKIRGLIVWLSKETQVSTALDRILGCFQEKDRKALKEKVLWSLQVYKGKGEVGVQENMLPRSFHKIFADCRLPSWCMDIATKQKFLLPCQVESFDKPTTIMSCLPILQTIINIVNPTLNPVILQGRVKYSIGNLNIFTTETLNSSEMKKEERKDLFLSSLSSQLTPEEIESVPEELQGLVLILEYWSNQELVTSAHVYAILLARSILREVDPHTNFARSEKKIKEELNSPKSTSEKKQYLQTMSKYATLFHMEENMKTSTKKYVKDIVHCFGVLQSIVYTSSILNTLLGDVVILPKISEFVSGTFLYNVVMYISKKPEQLKDCFLPEKMREEFLRIFNLISSFLPNLQSVNTKHMKKKKPKQKTETSEYSDFIESDLAESESETGFFDVENRFSALKVS
ncbi:protein asteroid [Eurytemora carolleeae]|uniref:protein asteroid n=1 Tax=Eurytemora carolleeae TaxID=1294199 RepID=UPI000C75C479|nr:protein asteroid [Eurytemora carolleeae]|eukprot:XP_023324004.1 protein asteroid-like [Eurytemora affinis]